MSEDRRKFTREAPEARKTALIEATLDLVADKGLRGATVRAIAERADVTQGLIRHYFSSKEELISAAYDHHMTGLTELAARLANRNGGSALERLAAFVTASLTPPVVDARSVALWAGFLNTVQQDPDMHRIHAKTYTDFRDRLEALIADALREAGTPIDAATLRRHAIAANAVIDGLWLEGGALPEAFEPGELPRIGLTSVGAITGLNLHSIAQEQME
ncbi:TetR family transcriptional regulator C-terminal domain-containing protein [Phaeobacter sp. QD34_3]|uniref:TetR family transcriptional regulator C-terminal domain-containing protein n=1 Tax=unclassified Phaeobacter TaxID=2621772 RepID=UPI00237F13D1|nr:MULTISPECIES: TetR family transcriptional regulator C-terminal domain-containing protein [unclassified Phaeobacter]MDE4134831.1 TetR family transcriptional regulator C-terminal domain-containing protein [Phaeobacter sp. QD34_3]MDE4137740.1 TetR family transcriptional regulator C-terminal domain-containing protein [Phaeobacter sp. QD34_24]MDE4176601.1 TetR family transcriptional regulator C-terminal domain-containing protein [Phaeobacter sp. PT47_59]